MDKKAALNWLNNLKPVKEDKFWRIFIHGIYNNFVVSELYGTRTRTGLIKEWKKRQSRRLAIELTKEMEENGFLKIHSTVNAQVVYKSNPIAWINVIETHIKNIPYRDPFKQMFQKVINHMKQLKNTKYGFETNRTNEYLNELMADDALINKEKMLQLMMV